MVFPKRARIDGLKSLPGIASSSSMSKTSLDEYSRIKIVLAEELLLQKLLMYYKKENLWANPFVRTLNK